MESTADESPNQPPTDAGADRAQAKISSVNPSASEMLATTTEIVPVAPPVRGLLADIESHISEFAADVAGSLSPFGDDLEFPLPVERLGYRHPGPANRPALAGD